MSISFIVRGLSCPYCGTAGDHRVVGHSLARCIACGRIIFFDMDYEENMPLRKKKHNSR